MCGRFTSSQRREALAERFQVAVPQDYEERFNLAPVQRALIVREREAVREAVLARWGLFPHWAADSKVSSKMINARAETLAEKPAFRSLLGKYRCLVVADGFYEWRPGADGKKQPLYFQLAGGEAFAFAGLWTSRDDPETDERIESCTIVTTRPNALVEPVHDRMPVILPRDLESVWLDPDLPREHALSLLEPFDPDRMQVAPASPLVNSVRNEGPELLRPDQDQLEPIVAAA
jgi:putative SOS response-associated peptidase YedK